ncbi:hypothetical protein D3C81_1059300 [compost metagenome]
MKHTQDPNFAILSHIYDDEREAGHHQFTLFLRFPGFGTRLRVFSEYTDYADELIICGAGDLQPCLLIQIAEDRFSVALRLLFPLDC